MEKGVKGGVYASPGEAGDTLKTIVPPHILNKTNHLDQFIRNIDM